MLSKRIEVAVGVVFNQFGQILVAKRHPHQHQGDAYEFPGGKIEPGETVAMALKRELLEEVGIEVVKHEPWIKINHDYSDKSVCLQVHKVFAFIGEPRGCEGQAVQWINPEELVNLTLPEANQAIIKALNEENKKILLV
ncbi:MAG: 8-oxo-dGTP diphosphatase MutT [Gammaproteobacteria bacterium]|jgi:8-oxo-dGTP diphosphatase|nr:8-oxo-dGTP diphosphatase MutT [Gammaproteobacteria bacterium]